MIRSILCSLVAVAALLVTACATEPTTYAMTPEAVLDFRSRLGNVGVTLGDYEAKAVFTAPAKGGLEGAKRGFVAGVAMPVLIGVAAPIPGSALAGVLAAPFGGIYGAVVGAGRTPPVEEVDAAAAGIEAALERLTAEDLRGDALETFVRLAGARSGLNLVPLPDRGPREPTEEVRYSRLRLDGIDSILEIRIERGGLWGFYDIDPPTVAFLEARVRLIDAADDRTLLEDTVVCVGERRKYVEWGEDDGQRFYEDILACIPRLREKIIDDLFLVHPVTGS